MQQRVLGVGVEVQKLAVFILTCMFVLTATAPLASSAEHDSTTDNLSPQENLQLENIDNFSENSAPCENLPDNNVEWPVLSDFLQHVNPPVPCDSPAAVDSPMWAPLQPFSGEGWNYLMPITITERSGRALENYQVQIILDTASLLAADKLRGDLGDLRFSWEGYALPYWIENRDNTATTSVRVRVPWIPPNGSTTIYAYYGNPNATSAENGDAVFEFYDNFDNLGPDKWDFAAGGTGVFSCRDGLAVAYGGTVLQTSTAYIMPDDFAIEFDGYASSIGVWSYVGVAGRLENGGSYFAYYVNDGQSVIQNYSSGTVVHQEYSWGPSSLDAWHRFKATAVGPVHTFYMDGENRVSMVDNDHPSGRAGMWTFRAWPSYWDNFRVRKHVEPEPDASFGAEEKSPFYTRRWWDSAWTKRRAITITGPQPENYALRLTLPFYDGSIRFLERESSGELPYWVESWTADSMTVWVRRLEPATGMIYVYYSNPSAGLAPDSGRVFDILDNFAGATIDSSRWIEVDPGNHVSQDGRIVVDGGTGSWSTALYSADSYRKPLVYEFRWTPRSMGYSMLGIHDNGTGCGIGTFIYGVEPLAWTNAFDYYNFKGGKSGPIGSYSIGAGLWWRFVVLPTGVKVYYGPSLDNLSLLMDDISIFENRVRVGFSNYDQAFYFDDVRAYRCAYPEPDVVVGQEENFAAADTTPPVSSVTTISPYWHNTLPLTITATASDNRSGVAGVELWSRYSWDNSNWFVWTRFGVDSDNSDDWSWSFTAPDRGGYYEFYSVAVDGVGNQETAHSQADARCGVDTTPPRSSVQRLTGDDYWKTGSIPVGFTLGADVSDSEDGFRGSGIESAKLYYRYSMDNGRVAARPWSQWKPFEASEFSNVGWRWEVQFSAVEGYGYYEFFAVATDATGNVEAAPGEADAGARVAKNLVRVAVILAKPQSFSPPLGADLNNSVLVWNSNAVAVNSYYTEASYGALDIEIDMFTKGGDWFELPEGAQGYPPGDSGSKKLAEHAIDAAVLAGVPIGSYQMVAVASPYDVLGGDREGLAFPDVRGKPAFVVYAVPNIDTVAHEAGHILGALVGRGWLPDLFPGAPNSQGDVDGWDLMGQGWWIHPSSWSKERLGWLEYESAPDFAWIKALPTLSYENVVYRYKQNEWSAWWGGGKIWYLLEVRTDNWRYSSYDRSTPGTGLVLYKVEETYDWFGQHTRVGVVDGVPFTNDPDNVIWYDWYEDVSLVYEAKEGDKTTRFGIWDEAADADTYKMRIGINQGTREWNERQQMGKSYDTGRLYTSPYDSLYDIYSYPAAVENTILPDLDLHAYTSDGRHIGVNYETGEYEIQIENASASGDMFQMSEWISVPSDIKVYFTISARDVQAFLENHPDVQLENGFCAFDVMHSDNMRNDYTSTMVGDEISPGAEIFYDFQTVQNPDGTYSVDVKQGMDLFSLKTWQVAIDNIPNELFITPGRRHGRLDNWWAGLKKQELKQKFKTVFRILEENRFGPILRRLGLERRAENWIEYIRYKLAIRKLENDILEKLNADGRADWTREPVLVDELKAFIAYLKNKAPPRPSRVVERYIDGEAERWCRGFEDG